MLTAFTAQHPPGMINDRHKLLPPQAIFDALQEFFVDQVSRADIINAWNVSHTQALRNGIQAPDDGEIIQQSINLLLDTAGIQDHPLKNNTEETSTQHRKNHQETAVNLNELPSNASKTPNKSDNQPRAMRTSFSKEPAVLSGSIDRKGKKRVLHIDCTDDDDDADEVSYMPSVPSTSKPKRNRNSLIKDNPVDNSGGLPLPTASTCTTPLRPQVLTQSEIISKIHEIIPDVEPIFAIQLYHRQPHSVETTEQRILHVN
ncbi:hypothetical protein DFH28DRAFT_303171 [Melampsora americana]|nr:hypothetical protein DFH28DRAFT_303171 [Melampsora americana]